ncbi:MAG TPA: hypothetical protein VM099_01715, partial [Gemmatimonadaceae bacterium]|nr:hypothetical protein [Gemmatimonadaceae bacterium]
MPEIESSSESHQSLEQLQRHEGSAIAYFLLTFVASWVLWTIAANLDRPAMAQAVFLLGTFMPGILALALTFKNQGESGCKELLGRIVKVHLDWRWYLFAIGYIPALKLLAAGMHKV